jgi:hypothetical protein
MELVKAGVVEALLHLLADSRYDIQIEATAALRNLAIVGDETVYAELISKNLMQVLLSKIPALSLHLSNILNKVVISPKVDENAMDIESIFNYSEHIIAFVWNLM